MSKSDDWAEAETVEGRHTMLDDAIDRLWVVRGRPGRRSAGGVLSRLAFDWKMPEDVGPIATPDDETLASWAG